MRALVTGGTGFIGSHIAQALCKRGDRVIVIDNLAKGALKNLDWKSPGDLLEFVEGDVGDENLMRKLIAGCDFVFHQAAMPSVPVSVADPLKTNQQNLDNTLKLLLLAREAKLRRFVFASSSSIYGDSDAPAKHEKLPPAPMSPYALQKYAAERYCQLFHRLYGVPAVALRYFNVFGPRQSFDSPYSGVIAKFCTSILGGEPPTIHGDGLQSRDFTYIDNVVQGNLKALEAAAAPGRIYNIACGQSISLLQLINELNRLTGQNLSPRFESRRVGDVYASLADITEARRDLGYECFVNWQEGLKRTLDYYREIKVG